MNWPLFAVDQVFGRDTISHEIRNVCGAIFVVSENPSRHRGLAQNEDFCALGNLVEDLGKITPPCDSAKRGERGSAEYLPGGGARKCTDSVRYASAHCFLM